MIYERERGGWRRNIGTRSFIDPRSSFIDLLNAAPVAWKA
jgi:hypothetical protein